MKFNFNYYLCNVETIQWADIVNRKSDPIEVDYQSSSKKLCKRTLYIFCKILHVVSIVSFNIKMRLALFSLLQVKSVTEAVTMARVGLLALKTARLVSSKYSGDFK